MADETASEMRPAPFELAGVLDEIVVAAAARLAELPAVLRENLAAVVLGGGYGRGEGGVYTAPDGRKRLYNDLDFFVFTKSVPDGKVRGAYRAALAPAERELSRRYELEVEFGPATGLGELAKLAPTLMYQELIRGMRPVWGDFAAVKRALPELPWTALPAAEGARLLLNRGAGLLLAERKLETGETAHDAAARDFAVRNIHKAALAVGDAWLLARSRYEFGLLKRQARLAADAEFPASSLKDYQAAIRFKFAPFADPAADLAERWARVAAEYLGAAADYAVRCPPAGPSTLVEACKNVLRQAVARVPGVRVGDWTRHPRQALQRLLLTLLVDKLSKRRYSKCVQYSLKGGEDRREAAFLRGWRRFN